MHIFDIFKPTTATIEFGQRVFNLVYRVVFTTVAIFVLGTLAIGIGYAANLGAQVGGASNTVKQFVQIRAKRIDRTLRSHSDSLLAVRRYGPCPPGAADFFQPETR